MEGDEVDILKALGAPIPEHWMDAKDPWVREVADLYFTVLEPKRCTNILEKPMAWLELARLGDEISYRAKLKAMKKRSKR